MCVCVLVAQSYPTICDPMDYSFPDNSVHEFCRQEYWNGVPFPPPGFLLKQGSNLGLLHCRQILYHLSHQGSPCILNVKEESPE